MTTPNARLTPEQLAEVRKYVDAELKLHPQNRIGPSVETVAQIFAELDAVTHERDEARKDSELLDWWDLHMHDGPSVGLYTDGRLGLARGHLVDSKWTVKGKPYWGLRSAIRAAQKSSDSAASNAVEKPEARCFGLISFGVFCTHPKGHAGPCESYDA